MGVRIVHCPPRKEVWGGAGSRVGVRIFHCPPRKEVWGGGGGAGQEVEWE